jgi:flagellar hook assembly protein FlgD
MLLQVSLTRRLLLDDAGLLPAAGNVSLQVYDVTGRTVRTLRSGFQKPGVYIATWNGRDERGREVPKGIYFYRLDTPGFTDAKKAVVLR